MLAVKVFNIFFVLLATLIRKVEGGGGGRGAAVWEIVGKLITPQEGELSLNFATCCNITGPPASNLIESTVLI